MGFYICGFSEVSFEKIAPILAADNSFPLRFVSRIDADSCCVSICALLYLNVLFQSSFGVSFTSQCTVSTWMHSYHISQKVECGKLNPSCRKERDHPHCENDGGGSSAAVQSYLLLIFFHIH